MGDTSKKKKTYLRLIGHGMSIVRHALKIVELAGITIDLSSIDLVRIASNDSRTAGDLIWLSGMSTAQNWLVV